ncbi:MAG: cell division protein ZapE [Woeseiaceae bacterium]|nr:cell division protein ZapE [Woeseiaceae bacterium]
MHVNIRAAWEKSLEREGHERDPAQERLVARLEALQQALAHAHAAPRRIVDLLLRRRRESVRGLYIWGGVGRGKTFLMDLFFDTLAIDSKQRIHFHRMMADVHARLAMLTDVEDPLDLVSADIARDTSLLCFDEFFVSDIGDAMILGRLLEGLFTRGVTLVATSNSAPEDLYRDGLQRSRFLPAIALINDHTEVFHMDGDTDYRLRLLEQAGTYLTPDDEAAHRKLGHLFEESASAHVEDDRLLLVNGRRIRARRCAKGVAWFEFDELCDGPRSQNDYIELARWYPTVLLSGVPQLDSTTEDQARRFIALIDEFYDRRVKLILAAATEIAGLYAGSRLNFEFERTISRLTEMQSKEYLHAPHLA